MRPIIFHTSFMCWACVSIVKKMHPCYNPTPSPSSAQEHGSLDLPVPALAHHYTVNVGQHHPAYLGNIILRTLPLDIYRTSAVVVTISMLAFQASTQNEITQALSLSLRLKNPVIPSAHTPQALPASAGHPRCLSATGWVLVPYMPSHS